MLKEGAYVCVCITMYSKRLGYVCMRVTAFLRRDKKQINNRYVRYLMNQWQSLTGNLYDPSHLTYILFGHFIFFQMIVTVSYQLCHRNGKPSY